MQRVNNNEDLNSCPPTLCADTIAAHPCLVIFPQQGLNARAVVRCSEEDRSVFAVGIIVFNKFTQWAVSWSNTFVVFGENKRKIIIGKTKA